MKNTFVKVLSMMMALMMVVGMFSIVTVSAAECDHTKGEYIDGKEPTCQTPGFSRYTCGKCGEEWITDVIQASDEYHNVEEVPAIPASCLTAGYSAGRRCTVPGCTEIAEGCEKVADAKAHTFVGKEVAPTCNDKGWVVYTCTSCGKTAEWLNEKNLFLAAGQTYAEWAKVETGKAQLTHAYEWVIVTAPVSANGVCADGLAKGVCANCGAEKTAAIPVHNDASYTVNLNPNNVTCAEYKSGFACPVCGDIKPGSVKNDADKIGVHTVGYTVPNGTKFDVNNLPYKNAEKTARFTIKELKDMGFAEGQVISKDATCTAAGAMIVVCSCGEVSIKPVAVKAHTYGDWGKVQWPTQCTDPAVRVRTCACGAKDTKVVVEAAHSSHTTKDKVTAPGCTSIGFTETTCTNKFVADGVEKTCAYYSKHTHVDQKNHNWSDPKYVSGTCGSATYTKECLNGCKTPYNGTVAEPDANKTHKYGAEVTVPATCVTPSYKSKVCTICKHEVKTAIEGAQVDLNNHVYTDKLDASGNVQYVGAAPTCTTTGTKIVWCATHGDETITTAVAPLAAHDYSYNYVVIVDGKKVAKDGKLEATCQAIGYEDDGEVCRNCADIKTAATVIPVNPYNHAGTKTAVGAIVDETCQEGRYQRYNTTCCGLVKDYLTGVIPCKFEKTVPFNAPTCTTNGNHAYTACTMCGAKQPLSTVATGCTYYGCSDDAHALLSVTDNHIIPALGHKYNDVKAQKAPDCESTGFAAYQDCERCNFVKFNGVEYNTDNADQNKAFVAAATIPAHYNAFKVYKTAVAVTCAKDGVKAGEYCSVCEADEWVIKKETVGHTFESFTVNLKADGTPIDCTKATCSVQKCSVCGYSVTDYDPAVNTTAHDFPSNWTPITLNPANGEYTCNTNTMEKRVCADCGKEETRVKTYATGCYTTKGVEGGQKYNISYDCDKIAEFRGWSCDVCHNTVEVADLKHNVGDPEYMAPTCTADGYKIQYCTGCGLTKKAGTIAFYEPIYVVVGTLDGDYNHDKANGIVLEDTAAYTKYICGDCNETVTENKAAPAPQLAVTVTASAEKVAAGETFTVTYKLSGKAYEFAALNLQATIPANMTLIGIKSEVEGLVAVVAPNGGISLVVPNNAAGEAQKVKTTAEGTALFTLTYTVNKTATTANATVAVSDNAATNKLATATTAAIKVTAVGNLNGDTLVSAEDAQAIFAKVGTNDVAADVNLDGIVNLSDVIALAKFAASAKTAADYLEMVGELDKLEDEVFALLENGKLNDVNEDGIVNISDAYELIGDVEDALTADYTTLGNNVTMAAFVAAQNRA